MATAAAYANLFDDDDFETEEDLDEQLQRVVDAYDPRPQQGVADETPVPETNAPAFATANNLDSSIAYLKSALSAFGFPSELPLRSGKTEDNAKVCNLLYMMLHQRQRDVERHRHNEDSLEQLESRLRSSDDARQRLEARLLAKEKDIGGLENKLRTLTGQSRTEVGKLSSEVSELQRANVDLQRRHAQFQHELRRKDREFERLQNKLRDMLTEKKREAKANMDAASKFTSGPRSTAPRRDDDLYKRIVASYEEKQREVLQENRDLRVALESLQAEHRGVVNQQVERAKQLDAVKATVEEEFRREFVDLTPKGLEAKLRDKLDSLEQLTGLLGQQSASREDMQTAVERRLRSEIHAARRLLADQEALARMAVNALADAYNGGGGKHESTPYSDLDADTRCVERMEEDYRAKVVELESRMATAHLQGKGTEGNEEALKAEFEEERRLVETARLALVEEKARMANLLQQHRERLEKEAKDLGQERWEFENTRRAFQDTMRQFAPGFGAGGFLAAAVSKRSAVAAKQSNKDEEASAAGKRAAKSLVFEGHPIPVN